MDFYRFFLHDIEIYLQEIVDAVITGDAADPRSKELPRRWGVGFHGWAKCLAYDVRSERCELGDIVLGDEGSREGVTPSVDIMDLGGMTDTDEFDGRTLLLDFTGMEQPAIFYLLKCLREKHRVRRLFGAYTEPLRYRAAAGPPFEEAFDLTEEFIEFRALPGFLRPYDRGRGRQLVVYMGFEGRRFLKVLEEVNPQPRHTHAVFGIPAFQPGWQYLTLGSNQTALEISRAELHRAEANNPFDAFDVAERVAGGTRDFQLVLAPIGTKPHAVGAALYALRHDEALLIYDFPIKHRLFRTEGVGKTSVYDLTEIVLE